MSIIKEFEQKDLEDFHIGKYRCIIMQQETGHLCGYVDLPKGHPVADYEDYEDFWDSDIQVHGGITYMENYLHDSANNEREGNWIGFDCAHAGDRIPAYSDMYITKHDTFKNRNYVRKELDKLVKQLKELE